MTDAVQCELCTAPAAAACARCQARVCREHLGADGACRPCSALSLACRRRRMGNRIAVVAGAAVGGMMTGAVVAMVVASALGLPQELIVLVMLVAEMACGAASAYVVDRVAVRRLCAGPEVERAALPEARWRGGSPRP
jgi:hypothetical protein